MAGFIGSPPINFLTGFIIQNVDGFWLEVDGSRLLIPGGKSKVLAKYVGKEIVAGIRPENLHDEYTFLEAAHHSVLDARVENVELMGAETYLYLKTLGRDAVDLIARVNPQTKAQPR